MAKNTYYFSHDYNSRSDEKIQELLIAKGMTGYGIFWSIVEDLYTNANALRTNYKRIAYLLHADEIEVKSVVEDFDLFVIEGDTFRSLSVQRRLDERADKSNKARISAEKRWNKGDTDANAMRTQCFKVKESKVKESKVKESKGKESKVKESKDTTYPFFEDSFWKIYPLRNGKKVGKENCYKLFLKLNESDREIIKVSVINYSNSKSAIEGYAKDPERFFKNDYWKEWQKPEIVNQKGGGNGRNVGYDVQIGDVSTWTDHI